MKKKVELLVPFMSGFGGTEKVIFNLINAINGKDDSKIGLKVISYGGTKDDSWLRNSNYKIIRMGGKDGIRRLNYFLFLPFMLLYYVLKTNSNIVISTNPIMWSLIYFWKTVFHRKITVISWYHYSLVKKPVRRILLNMADKYFAISSGVKQELLSMGIKNNKIFLIYNPIPRSDKIISRPKEGSVFLYIGRIMLHGQKNLLEMFTVLNKLESSQWKLIIYGDGVETEVQEVKDYVKRNGLENRVSFKGFVKNPWEQIENATLLLLTSTYEGFGMVLAEAVSHGIFVVSSDCETGPADIINENNGKLYVPGNVTELEMILNNIMDGSLLLPDTKKIKNSIKKFYQDCYITFFEIAVLKETKDQ